MEVLLKRLICFTVGQLEPGHLEEDCPITTISEKILKYFCKRTNKIQDSTTRNHRKLSCRLNLLTSRETALKFTNVIGPFVKTLNNLLFSEIVLIG